MNNNFQKSKKIYGVQAAAVSIALGNEQLQIATSEVGEGWSQSGLACLIKEGTAASDTSAITKANVKSKILAARTEVVKAKGKADVVLCTPELFSIILEASGSEFTPEINNYMNATGQVGKWLGFTFVECTGLAEGTYAPEYYDYSGTKQTVAIENLAKVDFIMYNHEAFSIVPNFEVARIVDSENFAGSKAQVEMNCGYRVTSAAQVLVRSHA